MSDRSAVLATLQQACDKLLGQESPRLSEALELGTDSIDSLELIEVMIEVEDRLGVRFREDEFDGVATVGQLLDVLCDQLDSVHA